MIRIKWIISIFFRTLDNRRNLLINCDDELVIKHQMDMGQNRNPQHSLELYETVEKDGRIDIGSSKSIRCQ